MAFEISYALDLKKRVVFFLLFAALNQVGFSQTVIGSFPSLDGGFEGQATGNLAGGSAGSLLLTNATWSVSTIGTITRAIAAVGGRSGSKYLSFGANGSGTAKNLFSPQLANSFAPSTTYQVQFYYKTASLAASLEASKVDLYVDNNSTSVAGTAQSVAAGLTGAVPSWTKVTAAITTAATPASGTKGVVGLTIDAITGGVFSIDIDDYVVYQSATPDNTAPNAPSSLTVAGLVGSVNVSWGAPIGGIDGGGYVIVRYTANPTATDDPNQKGIYSVGNAVGSNTGVVKYIGVGTSFVDYGVSANADYYYKVYAVDKAFNYSNELSSAASRAASSTNFYYKGSGSVAALSNWGINTDGTSIHPINFSTAEQIFNLRNLSDILVDTAWTVTGTGAKIIVGDGSHSCNFIIPTAFAVTAKIDVAALATLTIANSTIPTLGILATTSTVAFTGSAAQVIPAASYGNLVLSAPANGNTSSLDSFTVTVENGYGSGIHKLGDTVHIWSNTWGASETFKEWQGDTVSIIGKDEWHTWFKMPAHNITLNSMFKSVTNALQFEKIKGKNSLKNVYYAFPQNHQGIVYLFHGSNGAATNWTASTNYENLSMVNDLISAGFAVIITEAEEVTLGNDTNGDGSKRWVTDVLDSAANVDFANLKAITDSFYNRGLTNRSIPRFSIGQSNGGSYSIAFGSFFNFKATVAYCASGGASNDLFNTTTTPLLYCLQQEDNNSVMGQQGNLNAINNAQLLVSKGVCSPYYLNPPSPLYAARFARTGLISTALSNQIFNELKANHLLTAKNYLIGYTQNVWDAVAIAPQNFPITAALTITQKTVVEEQLDCTVTDHQFFSDHNKATIQFLKTQCQ